MPFCKSVTDEIILTSFRPIDESSIKTDSNEQQTTNSKIDLEVVSVKLYFKRWLVLLIFSLISGMNAFHSIQYNIIQDIVVFYYTPSLPEDKLAKNEAVNWMVMTFMLTYIVLAFPVMFILDRKGLRVCIIIGALTTAIGAWIKIGGVNPKRFFVAMTAQVFCAIGQAFLLGLPARVSGVWFGQSEVSLATSIGVFGNQLGTAIGFLVPPSVIPNTTNIEFLTMRFYYLLLTVAAICTILLIFAIICTYFLFYYYFTKLQNFKLILFFLQKLLKINLPHVQS